MPCNSSVTPPAYLSEGSTCTACSARVVLAQQVSLQAENNASACGCSMEHGEKGKRKHFCLMARPFLTASDTLLLENEHGTLVYPRKSVMYMAGFSFYVHTDARLRIWLVLC